ncbi:triosephosphate isomerase [Fusarium proliferatum]|nr:triosephosphate isomerase [Fusarium proliferatum]KAG4267784.1 triosephosphate isomerase [Fusarium proliferatum]
MARKFFVGGNFKMNGSKSSIKEIVDNLNNADLDKNAGTSFFCSPAPRIISVAQQNPFTPFAGATSTNTLAEVVVSPPAIYLPLVRETLRKDIEVAAQNVFNKPNGAFTGEISVSQLKDSDINWVILGHSERREILGESDETISAKTKYATENGLKVIWCCGETLETRETGKTIDFVSKQLESLKSQISDWSNLVIAYEPIWAIGTGKVATTEQAQEVHKAIRDLLRGISDKVADETRILYGGSVNEKNCGELSKQPDIDGFLVGGASLKPAFVDIINATKQ